jgi:hypothetical protein
MDGKKKKVFTLEHRKALSEAKIGTKHSLETRLKMTKREKVVRGEAHHNSKLTNSDVLEILNLYTTGIISMKSLSHKYGVSRTVIHLILRGKLWTHVTGLRKSKN